MQLEISKISLQWQDVVLDIREPDTKSKYQSKTWNRPGQIGLIDMKRVKQSFFSTEFICDVCGRWWFSFRTDRRRQQCHNCRTQVAPES